MASTLTLDRSDPGVDELVSTWKDGGKYRVEIEITQTKSSPNTAAYDVTGITDLSADTIEEAPEAEPETPSKSAGRIPAMRY